MTKQIRRIATIMLVLFGALFVNLNLIQLVNADDLATHPANQRLLIKQYQIERGPIVVGEQPVARSVPTDDELKYLRRYEQPELYAHVTGYASFVLGRSGIEAAANEALAGAPTEVLAQNLGELLGTLDETGNTVRLSIDPAVQAAAAEALGDRTGAIVALNPTTGAVLASVSRPSFDPNPLSSHDAELINDTWDQLRTDESRPLIDRVTRDFYPPGSSFKLVVAAAALESGLQPDTAFEDMAVYDVPQTDADIGNFSSGPCGDGSSISLAEALEVSCNTVFAKLGVDLGAEALVATAERLGYNRTPPYDLPTIESQIPKQLDVPATAQSAIGERDVRVTPLHAAMIVSAIVNGGQLPEPYVIEAVLEPAGRRIAGPSSGPWSEGRFDAQAISTQSADQLEEMMLGVVEKGTGTAAQIDGVRVGGKTGTATASGGAVWFVGFAEEEVAVAVVLPAPGEDATGGGEAAPLARAVMQAALDRG